MAVFLVLKLDLILHIRGLESLLERGEVEGGGRKGEGEGIRQDFSHDNIFLIVQYEGNYNELNLLKFC